MVPSLGGIASPSDVKGFKRSGLDAMRERSILISNSAGIILISLI
jgi:hypothetical protein